MRSNFLLRVLRFWLASVLLGLIAVSAHAQVGPSRGVCPPGFTAKSDFGVKCYAGKAQNCPAGTAYAQGTGKCTVNILCPAGYAAVDGACRAAAFTACPAGYAATTGVAGQPGCIGPPSPACGPGESFNPGEVRNVGGAVTVAEASCVQKSACPAGYVSVGSYCVVNRGCPAGMSVAADGGCASAPACPAGTTFSSTHGLCVAQPACPAGGRLSGDRCTAAMACPAGTSQLPDGRCASSTASPTCTPPSMMTAGGTCVRPTGCPSTFTKDPGSNRCVGAPAAKCPGAGSLVPGSASLCAVSASCPTGFFIETIEGRSTCFVGIEPCPAVAGWGGTRLDWNNATCYMSPKCFFMNGPKTDSDWSGNCR